MYDEILYVMEEKRKQLYPLKDQLSKIEFQNKLHNQFLQKLKTSQDFLEEFEQLKQTLTNSIEIVEFEMKAFTKQNIARLEEMANLTLRYLRPRETYRIKLKTASIGHNKFLHVLIGYDGDSETEYVSPSVDLGKFMKQLLSFAIIMTINVLLGVKECFLDEPLSSASGQSLLLAQDILKNYKMTYYVIDQKEEMYNKLNRKEIHLQKKYPDSVSTFSEEDNYRGYTIITKELFVDGEPEE